MQQWFALNDQAIEEAVRGVRLFREFADLDKSSARLPTTARGSQKKTFTPVGTLRSLWRPTVYIPGEGVQYALQSIKQHNLAFGWKDYL